MDGNGNFMLTERNTERFQILRAEPLVVNGKVQLGRTFPLLQGWLEMNLRINLVVTIGTGAGPVSEGELLVIKSINFRTDRNEVIVANVPGRGMFKTAVIRNGTVPQKDAIAAASATYSVNIPIQFIDEFLLRPNDTILDTSRYNTVSLEVQLGGVADLFTAPGTATMTATLDLEVLRTKEVLPPEGRPVWYQTYQDMPPAIASSQTFVDLERAPDLAIKRLVVHSGATATAGVEWSGANDDTIQDIVNVKDSANFIVQERIHAMVQAENRATYSLEALLAGVEVHDFVSRTGSLLDTIFTNDRSKLQYTWSNQAGVVATDQVTVLVDGIRSLR